MTFGESGKNGVRIDDPAQVQKTIDAFKSHGHTELDTARMCPSPILHPPMSDPDLQRADGEGTTEATLAKLDLSSTTLDTKVYPVNPGDHSPAKLRATFETSLKTLNRPSVRILYLHAPDRATPFADTLEEVDKLHKEGKFEILGRQSTSRVLSSRRLRMGAVSNYAAWEVAQVCGICDKKGFVRPKVYQVRPRVRLSRHSLTVTGSRACTTPSPAAPKPVRLAQNPHHPLLTRRMQSCSPPAAHSASASSSTTPSVRPPPHPSHTRVDAQSDDRQPAASSPER